MANAISSPAWTIGAACAWIMTRNVADASAAMDRFFGDVDFDRQDQTSDPYAASRTELMTALVEGDVTATGLLPSLVRVEIPAVEWYDMRHDYQLGDDGLAYRGVTAAGVVYSEILISSQRVKELWTERLPVNQMGGSRGPKPKRRQEVEAAMRRMGDMARLQNMKEVEMEAQFHANRDTCRQARRAVLSELKP